MTLVSHLKIDEGKKEVGKDKRRVNDYDFGAGPLNLGIGRYSTDG